MTFVLISDVHVHMYRLRITGMEIVCALSMRSILARTAQIKVKVIKNITFYEILRLKK